MKTPTWVCPIISWTLSASVLYAENPARKEVVLPFFIESKIWEAGHADEWWTHLSVFNPHPSETDVLVTILDATGNTKRTASLRVRGFQSGGLQNPVSENFTGWIKAAASEAIILRQQISHLEGQVGDTTVLSSKSHILLIPPVLTQRQFIHVGYDGSRNTNTGLAIVYPSGEKSSFTTGKLIFRWIDGRLVTEKTFTIAANHQLVGLFTEFLPESLKFSQFDLASGTVEVVFDKPVAVIAIQITVSGTYEEMGEPLSGRVESAQ